MPQVNGTYKNVGTRNGPPAFVKSDLWDGENTTFEVLRTPCGTWQIWVQDNFRMVHFFYESTIAEDLECYQLPVGKRWKVWGLGELSLPTVEVQQWKD